MTAGKPAKLVWYNLDSPTPPTSVGAKVQVAQLADSSTASLPATATTQSLALAFPTWSHDGNTIIYSVHSNLAGARMAG
jgi:hypothetical protein